MTLDIITHYCIYKFNNANSGSKDSTRRKALLNLAIFLSSPVLYFHQEHHSKIQKPATHTHLLLFRRYLLYAERLEKLKITEF